MTGNAAGFWGDVTSTYDWCEPNYQISYFVAEFFNTLTSIPVFLVGIIGIINGIRYGYETKFFVSNAAIAIVGIGSIAFHGTLLSMGQILDEVPMLWASLSMVYIGITFTHTTQRNVTVLIGTIAYGLIASIVYFKVSFEMFIVAYSISVGTIVVVSFYQLSVIRQQSSIDIASSSVERYAWKYASMAGLFYVGGFLFLWLPEQLLCGNRLVDNHTTILTRINLHSLFHLSSSVGPYCWIIFATLTRYHLLKRNPTLVYETTFITCNAIALPCVKIEILKPHSK